LGRPLNETFAKSPFLPDRCTSPLKTFTVEEQSELIRKGKIGLSQRVADIGSAQKPPQDIEHVHIHLYIKNKFSSRK